MRKNLQNLFFCAIFLGFTGQAASQNTVPVCFRHYPSEDAAGAYVPGSFNGWGPNSNGRIAVDAPSRMAFDDLLGCYIKTVDLQTGGSYAYKFHEHLNASGSSYRWLTDPLNRRSDPSDNNNSLLDVGDAAVFQIHPAPGTIVTEGDPVLAAGFLYRKSDSLDLAHSRLMLDGTPESLEGHVQFPLRIYHRKLSGLAPGIHTAVIRIVTLDGKTAEDSTHFSVFNQDVFFVTPSGDTCLADERTIRWRVKKKEGLSRIALNRIGGVEETFTPTADGYEAVVRLDTGWNRFLATALYENGSSPHSDTLSLFFPERQEPDVDILLSLDGQSGHIVLTADAEDPQADPLSFYWSCQEYNLAILQGLDGRTEEQIAVAPPAMPGDYGVRLDATDDGGHCGTAIRFFTVTDSGSVRIPDEQDPPSWVPDARIYTVFVKSFTHEGTFRSAEERLPWIRSMGFNVIWLLPVMDVEGEIDTGVNIGYNIVDFFRVDPAYGSEADFRSFIHSAHEAGIRVILDVTPNHSSRSHPLALDVRARGPFSRYYDFYQHAVIPHNDSGLGQTVSPDGIVYYTDFSDALLNWNWSDAEAREYMLAVYRHWIRTFDIDGFRFDVYWGPNRRYGPDAFDRPLRKSLRSLKTDLLLLGEAEGTGTGTEFIYADQNGGVDAAYDWSLLRSIQIFPSISELNERLVNGSYRPGPDSYYLRFLENQDEDRAVYRYGSVEKTMPVSAAVFLSTGIPMLFQGQEMGMGFGMGGGRDYRVRSEVDWGNPNGEILGIHYQKIAWIRKNFPAFRTQFTDTNGDGSINSLDESVQPRLETGNASVYAFGRPWPDQNGVVVLNFSQTDRSVKIGLNMEEWALVSGSDRPCYIHDFYGGKQTILDAIPDSLELSLPGYGAAVFVISDEPLSLDLPPLSSSVKGLERPVVPQRPVLHPNYPNPFNSRTTFAFEVFQPGSVRIEVFDASGRLIRVLKQGMLKAGFHTAEWDGKDKGGHEAGSGIYLVRLRSRTTCSAGKMVLIR
ncbi:T9SS type A sorting domain-containing protein [bacterium]|nr:T9SS type A sorting domain-containing protein [bacterium]